MTKFLELFDLLSYMQEKDYNYFTTLFNRAGIYSKLLTGILIIVTVTVYMQL